MRRTGFLMPLPAWVRSLRKKKSSPQPAPRQPWKGKGPHFHVELLEPRTMLSVSSSLDVSGLLNVTLDHSDDAAAISVVSGNIRVSDGSSFTDYSASSVHAITVTGS